ncbi:hypothetical protein GF337_13140 [candidate division KSB1 bacterium]|nr:hypothetical protein [candidate division KSB1 bacterium]
MFENFQLEMVGSIILFIALVAAFIAYTFFMYRRTNPPVSGTLRKFLVFMRGLVFLIIIFILFEPLLSLTWTNVRKPIIAVLTDTSASMDLTDAKGKRSEQARSLLQKSFLNKNGNDRITEFYKFSDDLSPLDSPADSLQFTADGTDISAALQQLNERMDEKYLAGVVLVTDGIFNIGENPARYAEDMDVPIYPVGIGDPQEQKDIVISRVLTNQVTYANNRVPVDITVKATGFKDRKVPLQLLKDGKVLDTQYIELTDDALETKARMHYVPVTPGNQKYSLQIPMLAGELTARNNTKNFYTKVLKDKMKILVISGSPSYDLAFAKRNLKSDENVETTYFTLKNRNAFYEGQFPSNADQLKIYDAIILIDFPRRNFPAYVINQVADYMKEGNKSLMVIGSQELHYPALEPLSGYLPIQLRVFPINEQLVSFQLTPNGLQHPLMRLSENEIENQTLWRDLPPIYYTFRRVDPVSGSETLLEVDKQRTLIRGAAESLPLIVARKMNQQKSLFLTGYGIWRWDFLMTGIGNESKSFSKFLSNCVRWLVTREDSKLVRIHPDKEIYRSGEKVTFTAEVYYEDYRPRDGATVKVRISGKSNVDEVELSNIGNGKYEGEFQVLEGGDYRYEGQAFANDQLLGEDSGRFSMEEFSLEFLETKMNEALLQQIAYKSGGTYFTPANIEDLKAELNFQQRSTELTRQWELWNKLVLLILIIVLLSIEWFIRKKKGML